MTRDSDITPYSDSASGSSSPPANKSARMRRVAASLKWAGLAGFLDSGCFRCSFGCHPCFGDRERK